MFGLILIYKLINGLVDCPSLVSQIGLNVPYYHGLGHLATFNIPFSRVTYAANNSFNRFLSIVNNLKIDIFNMPLTKYVRSCRNKLLS